MTKGRPCSAATAQEPSHATMPCTWTGYGASPPAAYKYRGNEEEKGGRRKVLKRQEEGRRNFLESRGKQAAETGKKRGGKRKEQGKTGKLQKRKKKGNQGGKNFGEGEGGRNRQKKQKQEGRKVLKREKRETFENREGMRDLKKNWRREPLPSSITTATSTANAIVIVATQFLTHVLINFQKNPKIAKNIENPKKIHF